MEYKKRYGVWAGCKNGTPADLKRCAATVFFKQVGRQCHNKAKYDPNEVGNPTTCGIHRRKPCRP